jgi:hypothetical protein
LVRGIAHVFALGVCDFGQLSAIDLHKEWIFSAHHTFPSGVGYDSEYTFNRAFKRRVGKPPAAWRKKASALWTTR